MSKRKITTTAKGEARHAKRREHAEDRNERATWSRGSIEIIRHGTGGPLISEAELDRILAEKK